MSVSSFTANLQSQGQKFILQNAMARLRSRAEDPSKVETEELEKWMGVIIKNTPLGQATAILKECTTLFQEYNKAQARQRSLVAQLQTVHEGVEKDWDAMAPEERYDLVEGAKGLLDASICKGE